MRIDKSACKRACVCVCVRARGCLETWQRVVLAWLQVAEAVGPDHQLGGHVAGVALLPPKSTNSGAPLDDTAANNVVPLATQHAQVGLDQS